MRNNGQNRLREVSLTLTIPQAAELLGISVRKAYAAARAGDLPIVKIGARVLVSRRRLELLIDGLDGRQDNRPDDLRSIDDGHYDGLPGHRESR